MKILIDLDISSFLKASQRFDEVLKVEKSDIVRDAAIQRFEFTYELAWKTLRKILIKRGQEENSPKMVFRSAAKDNLIENVEDWFEFVNLRNNTVHVYNEKIAEEIYVQLPKFQSMIHNLIDLITSENFQ